MLTLAKTCLYIHYTIETHLRAQPSQFHYSSSRQYIPGTHQQMRGLCCWTASLEGMGLAQAPLLDSNGLVDTADLSHHQWA